MFRIDRMPNARKDLCGEKKWVEERIYESVLQCFDHIERVENDNITKESAWEVLEWVDGGNVE